MRAKFKTIGNLDELMSAVDELNELFATCNANTPPIVFDFSESMIISPAFVVTVANAIEKLTQQGSICKCDGESPTDQIINSGLGSRFPGFDTSGHNYEWALPVTGFKEADPTLISRIVDDLGSRLPNLSDRNERFGQTVAELMENVRVHSDCPWGGFVCAQINNTERHIRLSLGDFGKGIPGTLSIVPPYNKQLSNDIVVYEAFKYWVTGQPGQRAGSGLAYAADFVRAINGVVRAYSGCGCIRIDLQNTCLRLAPISYPGTLFTMDLPLR